MKRERLSDSVADSILKMVENHEYDANGFLPSEGKLMEMFEVSRVTVREAVRTLEVRGFVKRIHGKGIHVVDNTMNVFTQSLEDLIIQDKKTLKELLEIRMIVEPSGAALAAERRTEEDLKKLYESLDEMENSVTMDDAYYEADLRFHLDLARATGNSMIVSLIQAYTSNMKDLIISSSEADDPIEKKFHYHRKIYDAIEKQDQAKAYSQMLKHLEVTRTNFLAKEKKND